MELGLTFGAEYRDLVESLNLLDQTLREVDLIFRGAGPLAPVLGTEGADIQALSIRTAERIRQCLDGFRQKIHKYGPSLAQAGSGNSAKDAMRKIQWRLESKDIEKFRGEVMGFTMSLKMLLEITTIRMVQRNHDSVNQKLSSLEGQSHAALQENRRFQTSVSWIGRTILSGLGYVAQLGIELKSATTQAISMLFTLAGEVSSIRAALSRLERPLNGEHEHFLLEDPTGRLFPVYLKTVTSWDGFECLLADRFKGKKGARRISRKRYVLKERATHRKLDRSKDWDTAFLPYQRVDMSRLCREFSATRSGTTLLSSCPRCFMVNSSDSSDSELQCQNCNMHYQRVVELDDEDKKESTAVNPGKESRNSRTPPLSRLTHRTKSKANAMTDTGRIMKSNSSDSDDSDEEDVSGFLRVILVNSRASTSRMWISF
ncbi:hypothetical protein B0T24DRAFT_599583 [Lasiosphaeria ovina]|uniref:Ubiquitin-like domain-containing protein n=1 Tax=Lasiosphaeria ovina TaxID=92902 RepID=A0AAE0JTK8_9PEZI|nr:hypothetical protein B0T24DRAFT_599583 [Lasiosphaeria ovina]